MCKVIFVCAILHNICKDRNLEIILEDDHGVGQPPAEDIEPAANGDGDDAGQPLAGNQELRYREQFVRLHFK